MAIFFYLQILVLTLGNGELFFLVLRESILWEADCIHLEKKSRLMKKE